MTSEEAGGVAAGSRTVVVGVGNPLMGDDGLGIVALERLREEWHLPPDVELVDGGTWGMNLLPVIEEADQLLIVDAIDAGAEPGELVVLERDDLPLFLSMKLSPHQLDLGEVLALAAFRGRLPAQTVAIGLQPAVVDLCSELSEVVAERVDALLEQVVARLRAWGHQPGVGPHQVAESAESIA